MTKSSIKDLGQWAEARFSTMCVEAGVVRNQSHQDWTGWDFLIEFPPKALPLMPADMQPAGISARVQVKSKQKGPATVSLKLSNALRFAKDPGPCFVVLFMPSDGQKPARVFARHYWTDLIAASLKKAREAEAAGNTDFHKLRLPVRFDPSDDHSNDLLAWMAAQCESVGKSYAEAKDGLLKTVGYEDGAYRGNLSFRLDELPAVIDHQIGLTPNAPIESMEFFQKRFGIESPLPSGKPVSFSFQSHPRPCRVRLRQVGSADIWVDGQLFFPGVPDLPIDAIKWRVAADFLECVFAGVNSGNTTLSYSGAGQRSLRSTRQLIDAFSMAENGAIEVTVVADDGSPMPAASLTLPKQNLEWLEGASIAMLSLELVVAAVGAPPAGLTLSLMDLVSASRDILRFNTFVRAAELSGDFTFESPITRTDVPEFFLAYGHVKVGDWVYMAVVARPVVEYRIEREQLHFVFGAPRVVEALIRSGTAEEHLPELRALYERTGKAPWARLKIELFQGDFGLMLDQGS